MQTDELMKQAMNECSKLGAVISAHCEVNSLLNGGYIHAGEYCKAHNHKGICSERNGPRLREIALLLKNRLSVSCMPYFNKGKR